MPELVRCAGCYDLIFAGYDKGPVVPAHVMPEGYEPAGFHLCGRCSYSAVRHELCGWIRRIPAAAPVAPPTPPDPPPAEPRPLPGPPAIYTPHWGDPQPKPQPKPRKRKRR